MTVATRNASKDLAPQAQSTIQTTSANVVARTSPIERGSLTDEPGGKPRNELADRRGGIVGLRRGAHEARPDDDAVGTGGGRGRRLLGRRDAESDGDGDL